MKHTWKINILPDVIRLNLYGHLWRLPDATRLERVNSEWSLLYETIFLKSGIEHSFWNINFKWNNCDILYMLNIDKYSIPWPRPSMGGIVMASVWWWLSQVDMLGWLLILPFSLGDAVKPYLGGRPLGQCPLTLPSIAIFGYLVICILLMQPIWGPPPFFFFCIIHQGLS